GPLAHASDDAEQNRERRDDRKGQQGKERRVAEAVPYERVHLRAPAMRVAEVALEQSVPFALVIGTDSEPLEITFEKRPLQSMLYAIELELFLRRVLPERALCLVAGRELERHEKDE